MLFKRTSDFFFPANYVQLFSEILTVYSQFCYFLSFFSGKCDVDLEVSGLFGWKFTPKIKKNIILFTMALILVVLGPLSQDRHSNQ